MLDFLTHWSVIALAAAVLFIFWRAARVERKRDPITERDRELQALRKMHSGYEEWRKRWH